MTNGRRRTNTKPLPALDDGGEQPESHGAPSPGEAGDASGVTHDWYGKETAEAVEQAAEARQELEDDLSRLLGKPPGPEPPGPGAPGPGAPGPGAPAAPTRRAAPGAGDAADVAFAPTQEVGVLDDAEPALSAVPELQSEPAQLSGPERAPDSEADPVPETLIEERSDESVLFSEEQREAVERALRQRAEGEAEGGASDPDAIPLAGFDPATLTDSEEAGSDLAVLPPITTVPAAPLLMPDADADKRKVGLGALLVTVVLAALVAVAAVAGMLYLFRPDLVRSIVAGPDGDAARGARGDGRSPAARPAAPEGPVAKPAPPGPDRAAVAAQPATRSPSQPVRAQRVRRPRRAELSAAPPAPAPVVTRPAARPATTAQPKATPAVRPAATDRLDRLLDAATGKIGRAATGPAPARRAPGPPVGLPRTLTRDQIRRGMARASGGVQDCKDSFKGNPGPVTIQVTIGGKRGRISRGKPVGRHAGSAGGDCVVGAVRYSAQFPRFSGPPITLKYPLFLR